jgi:hypothetical protein
MYVSLIKPMPLPSPVANSTSNLICYCTGSSDGKTQSTPQQSLAWCVALHQREKMAKESPQEECLSLAAASLVEAERTLDREVAGMFLFKARRYLDDAERIKATH